MEQFPLAPVSVYKNNNKNLKTLAVIKHELPKCQVQHNPTYQHELLKKELSKKLFAKADSLVDKILSYPCVKLSNPQTLIVDGVETGVLLSDVAQQLRFKNADVPDNYFTSFDAACIPPTLVLIKMPKPKGEEAGSVSKYERHKLKKLYTQRRVVLLMVCTQFSENYQPTSIKCKTIFIFNTFVHKIYGCSA